MTRHRGAVVVRELTDRPDLLGLQAAWPQRYPMLLESAAHGTAQGRYDLLPLFTGEALSLGADGRLSGPGSEPGDGDFLAALDRWHTRVARPDSSSPPQRLVEGSAGSALPFTGGWLLYLGYELAAQIEPTLGLRARGSLPSALALRCPAALVCDHMTGRSWLVAERECSALLADMLDDVGRCPALPPDGGRALVERLDEDRPADFLRMVARAQDHIRAGDIYQANLSRGWRGRLLGPVSDALIYARLRKANPGPFAALFRWQEHAVLSSSPERLLRIADGWAETRPIAGTRPRGRGVRRDRELSRELLGHPKERAEHVMLIDLERNDLGRFCRPGTVEVNEYMVLESYSHVHHIVSNVRGRPEPGGTSALAIRAMFPGGTITGCPKVRCMQIIAALEGEPRGPYTGSLGYLNRDGSLDLNILIRTLERAGSQISLRAGGGIVADSQPELELAETRAKARGVLLALEQGG